MSSDQEKFIIEAGNKIVFDIQGTEEYPLSEKDKKEIKERLEQFITTLEAQEQFKILKNGQHGGYIRLVINPAIETGGISFGMGIIVLSSIKNISNRTLPHELEHECQEANHPGLWNPKNYDNAYDYFKTKYLLEAEAELKGLWFEISHPPKEGLSDKAKAMLAVKEHLKKSCFGITLKKAVFKEYFHTCMLGGPWETHYKEKYTYWPVPDKWGQRPYVQNQSYFKKAFHYLGFGEEEDLQLSRLAALSVTKNDSHPENKDHLHPAFILTHQRVQKDYYDRITPLSKKIGTALPTQKPKKSKTVV